MSKRDPTAWSEANQRYLTVALARLRVILEDFLAKNHGGPEAERQVARAAKACESTAREMSDSPALERVRSLFHLTPFERDVLLLSAAIELDASFASVFRQAYAKSERALPTFSLALAALPDAHWSALSPDRPLRHWRLIEVGSGEALVGNPLRIDERVLHYLAGVHHLDERLAGLVRPLAPIGTDALVDTLQSLAREVGEVWSTTVTEGFIPAVQLCGGDGASRRAIASVAVAGLGLQLHTLSAQALPAASRELDALARLWQREAVLGHSALLVEFDGVDPSDSARQASIGQFIDTVGGILVSSNPERQPPGRRPVVTFEVVRPGMEEQRKVWTRSLHELSGQLNGQIDRLVSQFDLNPETIRATSNRVLAAVKRGETSDAPCEAIDRLLWTECRRHTRPQLENLAQRVRPTASWDDLVLPSRQLDTLRDIAIHVRHRSRVYESWGFAAKSSRGLGISALFVGASGTGKSMAAEVLANELDLDLYRIDLSQVVSKYIGETEKNLRRVFDAAEEGGAILLFDEADALFGKRSEVKDSHDRYANIEIGYLLQRMEVYRGLAILTTNMKNAMDPAFVRRLRFTIHFPFPDLKQRTEIWRCIFPIETPTAGLDPSRLGRLNVAGGSIRNIAMNAAFIAAQHDEPVRMRHLARATRIEYAKLETPLTESEVREWE